MSCSWDKGPTVTLWIITSTRGHSALQRDTQGELERERERERRKLHHFPILSISLQVPSRSCHCYQLKWSIMQNGDDFGFRGCDRENCGLMQGEKKRKERWGFCWAGREGQSDMSLWGLIGMVWGLSGKWGIRGLIKVTSECFILSQPACQTGNTLRGFAERGSEAIGGDRQFSVYLNISRRRHRTPGSGLPI